MGEPEAQRDNENSFIFAREHRQLNMFDARSVRRVRRLFYGDGRFEQSLDVYAPASANTPLPLVILVVGSAWLGHLRLVYGPTSWWNSSGPRTVASAGAVCVCIRHRGAFPPPPPAAARAGALLGSTAARLSWLGLLALALALSRGVAATVGGGGLLLLLLRAWDTAAVDSATIEEMVDDVAAALALVLRERDALLPAAADLSTGFGLLSDSAPRLSGRTYFGGYSSGAHVASSLLLPRPPSVRARARHGLPAQLCDCVLHISGVFGGGAPGYPRTLASVVFGASDGPVLPSPALSASQLPAIPQVHVRALPRACAGPSARETPAALRAVRRRSAAPPRPLAPRSSRRRCRRCSPPRLTRRRSG